MWGRGGGGAREGDGGRGREWMGRIVERPPVKHVWFEQERILMVEGYERDLHAPSAINIRSC